MYESIHLKDETNYKLVQKWKPKILRWIKIIRHIVLWKYACQIFKLKLN